MEPVSAPLPVHGGDLAAATARWGAPAGGWLDLSTGINPWPYPLPGLGREAWTRLPGAAEDLALRQAAAKAYGCDARHVLAAPGSSALIQALPHLIEPGRVRVLGPTYAEHARAWVAAGHHLVDDGASFDVLVAVNPNNPDGRLLPANELLDLGRDGRLTVVDEAFGDLLPEASLAGQVSDRLVVLKSFGKFYGLPGLRLGFLLAGDRLRERVAERLGPWPVSGPALAIGASALADSSWAQATRAHLVNMAARLDGVLSEAGLTVVGGTALFRLARHPDAAAFHDRLGRAGILVRAFADRPDLLRFGLPGGEADRTRLRQALLSPD